MTDARIDITDELMADWADGAYQAIDSRYPDGDREVALAEAVLHLVGELRETRERRCENCTGWQPLLPLEQRGGECEQWNGVLVGRYTHADWVCGDFTPKAGGR